MGLLSESRYKRLERLTVTLIYTIHIQETYKQEEAWSRLTPIREHRQPLLGVTSIFCNVATVSSTVFLFHFFSPILLQSKPITYLHWLSALLFTVVNFKFRYDWFAAAEWCYIPTFSMFEFKSGATINNEKFGKFSLKLKIENMFKLICSVLWDYGQNSVI